MLNSRLNRRPATRRGRIAILVACSSVALPIAGFAQRTFATPSGSIVDSMNGILRRDAPELRPGRDANGRVGQFQTATVTGT